MGWFKKKPKKWRCFNCGYRNPKNLVLCDWCGVPRY